MNDTIRRILFLTIFCLCLTPVHASATPLIWQKKPLKVTGETQYFFESDVHDKTGDIQITETEFKLNYELELDNGLPIELSYEMKHVGIEENLDVEIPTSLEGRSFGIGTKFPMPFTTREDFFVGVDVFPSWYTDDWDWRDSAFRMPLRLYGIYKPHDDFILVGGAKIRVDYDTPVVPVLGIIYKPNDRLSFNLASDDPNIAYKLNEESTVFWEFDYALDEYEVSRGTDRGVILKYRQGSTGVGFKYDLDHVQASVSAGGSFGRRLRYEDDMGKIEPDPGAYVKGKLSIQF